LMCVADQVGISTSRGQHLACGSCLGEEQRRPTLAVTRIGIGAAFKQQLRTTEAVGGRVLLQCIGSAGAGKRCCRHRIMQSRPFAASSAKEWSCRSRLPSWIDGVSHVRIDATAEESNTCCNVTSARGVAQCRNPCRKSNRGRGCCFCPRHMRISTIFPRCCQHINCLLASQIGCRWWRIVYTVCTGVYASQRRRHAAAGNTRTRGGPCGLRCRPLPLSW